MKAYFYTSREQAAWSLTFSRTAPLIFLTLTLNLIFRIFLFPSLAPKPYLMLFLMTSKVFKEKNMITTNFNPALAQFRPSAFGRLQRHIGVANHHTGEASIAGDAKSSSGTQKPKDLVDMVRERLGRDLTPDELDRVLAYMFVTGRIGEPGCGDRISFAGEEGW